MEENKVVMEEWGGAGGGGAGGDNKTRLAWRDKDGLAWIRGWGVDGVVVVVQVVVVRVVW